MIHPHKFKYFPLYWAMAYAAAAQSVAQKRKVGAVLVLPSGMISVGWNGMPAGFNNTCDDYIDGKYITRPEVIHAERNAIDKMTRQGVSTQGALLFTTYAPCFECAKAIHGLGLAAVHYDEVGNNTDGLLFLKKAGVRCIHSPQYHKEIQCPTPMKPNHVLYG